MTDPGILTDGDILKWIEETALEGFLPDDELIELVAYSLARAHRDQPDLAERVRRLAPEVLDELQELEASWPVPTDCDRLDRAFSSLDRGGVLTRQNFYYVPIAAAEEMTHEIMAARRNRDIHGYAYFHGGDTRRAMTDGRLRITWGPVLPRKTPKGKRERASWVVAEEIHAALRAQGLSPEWNREVGSPIELAITWMRRRKRRPAPPRK
jgi:hypothetical protein